MIKGIPLEQVAAVLPIRLANQLDRLSREEMLTVEELRLRRGHPMTVLMAAEECPLGGGAITEQDLREVLERASQASAHTILEQMRGGFMTLRGGHRIGLCGTVSRKEGEITVLRYLSSMSIRVARAVEGQAAVLMPNLLCKGRFFSTLILGAPGAGKTTLLRELIRTLSDGHGVPAFRVGVADERGEIAALWQGEAQFHMGRQTDVIDGCLKSEGLSMLLRSMNPQILAVDEIAQSADVAAVREAAGCGAALLATAHGENTLDLIRRPIYRELLDEGIFQRIILLRRVGGRRVAEVEVRE